MQSRQPLEVIYFVPQGDAQAKGSLVVPSAQLARMTLPDERVNQVWEHQ